MEALDGLDPVVLLKEGKEVFGKSAFRSEHGRFAYLFSTAETKAEFEKTPGKYSIQLGGVCARMGKTVTGNPSDYFVHDGKIYIFGSDACHKSFVAAPEKYLAKPAAPMPRDPAATTRGQALLDKVAKGMGTKLDALTTYVESTSETQKRPTGDVQITTRKLWRFPDAARMDRSMLRPDGQTATYGTLLTAGRAWGIGGPQLVAVIPDSIPSVQLDLGRQIVPLLRTRREAGTLVAALGAGTVDGVAVERVRVQRGGLDVTVNIDPATGRVHSTTFIDRNREGQFGEYTLVYGDFRQVDGLLVPFEEKAMFNGAADPSLSRKLETIVINSALDQALFQAPR
jgi:YHS domain-containing protein